MSKFQICYVNARFTVVKDATCYNQQETACRLAQTKSATSTGVCFVVNTDDKPLKFFANGQAVHQFQLLKGGQGAGSCSLEGLENLKAKGMALSTETAMRVTLTDLLKPEPMEFRHGRIVNPNFEALTPA